MQTLKFKLGDRVRVKDQNKDNRFIGQPATVTNTCRGTALDQEFGLEPNTYVISFDQPVKYTARNPFYDPPTIDEMVSRAFYQEDCLELIPADDKDELSRAVPAMLLTALSDGCCPVHSSWLDSMTGYVSGWKLVAGEQYRVTDITPRGSYGSGLAHVLRCKGISEMVFVIEGQFRSGEEVKEPPYPMWIQVKNITPNRFTVQIPDTPIYPTQLKPLPGWDNNKEQS